ncbi:MAG: flagellar filament capping protein FliD [Lachnospiraceae bacterium]|nr:flagellar filament capping protein FliD [Lachnospiraceae bacterium]
MIRLTGMNSGLDTDAMVKELVNAYEKKGQKTKNNKTKHEWKQTIWADLNKKIKSFNSKVKSMQYTSNYNQKKTVSSNESKVSVIAGDNAVRGTQTIKVNSLATTGYLTSKNVNLDAEGKTVRHITADSTLEELGVTSKDGKVAITVNGKTTYIDANKDTKVSQFVKALNAKDVGVDASFDEKNGRFFISAENSGTAGDFSFAALEKGEDGEYKAATNDILGAMGLSGEGVSRIQGTDAEIVLNGATFTSSSNSFDINGMAITVKGLTAKGTSADGSDDEVLSLTTETDTEAIYKNIKGLISEYSKLINELSKLYNAGTARKFEPLTDEEKDAMTDDEVEKWETKIKDSLLRRDENVAAVMNAMKNPTLASYEVNGKKLSLSDFGIGTLSYFAAGENEKSALHINGDEDDEAVSGETNKLKQMLSTDPDTVAKFFSKLMTDISDKFNTLSTSSTRRSYGNFYDDKKVKEEMTSYEKKVSDFEVYLGRIEDKYYKQFTQMEKAMAKLNSTQTQLSNYFGM